MEFTAVILFLILYFVRLHDWVPAMAGLNVIKPVMALGALGLLTRPKRTPAWGVMTTPHEWFMVIYLIYGIFGDPDPFETFNNVLPLTAFFFLTSQALTDEDRLDTFFCWWAGCIAFMCFLGAITDLGVDITGARLLIDAKGGRLCLNTWLLDNPNALGHTAITGFPLVYFAMMFRRSAGPFIMGIPMLIMVGMCVVATESKGAYLSAAAGITVGLLIGRSTTVKAILAALLFLAGSTAMTMLPRMVNKEQLRYDEGVMGRAMAFQAAKVAYDNVPAGWNRFMASFTWEGNTVDLSTHSSFVQIGADLGPFGMFMYLSIMGLAARSLYSFSTKSDKLERCRRLLFSILVCYFVSGWMINRSYHAEYFMMIGAAIAYHKLARESLRKAAGFADPSDSEEEDRRAAVEEPPLIEVSQSAEDSTLQMTTRASVGGWKKLWNRYGIIDFGIGYGLLYFTIWLWNYIIDYFITS